MAVDQDQRPSFYQEQYLGPEDLTATVEYGRIHQARHMLGAHTWGIAIGLQLIEKPSPAGNNQVDVFVTPGYAWDGFGRTLVALAPYKVSSALFQDIAYDASIDDPNQSGDSKPGRPVQVWLRYTEQPNTPTASGFQMCDVGSQMSRVQETFVLEIDPAVERDPITIGGKQVEADQALITFDPTAPPIVDASIPQQALPDDDAETVWLVPVGFVRWLPSQIAGQPGSFQQRTPKDIEKAESVRQYIGVVAGSVEAAGQNIEVKRRKDDFSTILSDDLLWIRGKLRIEDDLNLYGGKLTFLNKIGKDDGVPLLLQRAQQTDPNTFQQLTSLQVEIGKDNKGNNLFSAGPLDGSGNFVSVFNVLDSGKVGIGTTTPLKPLGIRGSGQAEELLGFEDAAGNTKWHINQNLGGNNSGLNFAETGVADARLFIKAGGNVGLGTAAPVGRLTLAGLQPAQGTLTLFSPTADIEYDGGNDQLFLFRANSNASTAFVGGKIGIGTTAPTNRLHVADANGIRQNRLYLSGDAGWSSVTYNAYHDALGSQWTFPDPTHPATTVEMDDFGGRSRFDIWTTTSTASTQWVQRFHIDGETGNIGINAPAPDGRLTIFGDAVHGTVSFFPAGADIQYDGGVDGIFWFVGHNNAKTAFLGGNFGVNVGNPLAPLDVLGDVRISGDITANGNNYPSDLRLKRDISPIDRALETLLRLRGISFRWDNPDKRAAQPGPQMGLIAQEVEKVFPDWVKDGVDGYKVVSQQGFVALLIEAIRELNRQLQAVTERLEPCQQPE